MTGGVGQALFWTPVAVSYVAQLTLAVTLAAYLGHRAVREDRQGRLVTPTVLLAVMMGCLAPTFLASLIRVLTGGGWVSYVMPWTPGDAWWPLLMPWAAPFGAVSVAALVVFAYRFPQRLPGAAREAAAVQALLAVLILAEVAIAVRASVAIRVGEAWWRPDGVTGWLVLAMIWAAVVFWRQLRIASRDAGVDGVGPGASNATLAPPRSREAAAARGFLVFSLLPIVHVAVLTLSEDGRFGLLPLDIFICWIALAQWVGFTLVLTGYLPERSSFVFKLTAISLAVVLAAINGAAWIVEPVHGARFADPTLPASGQATAYVPRADGGYVATPTAFAPVAAGAAATPPAGGRVALPFVVTAFGRRFDAVHVDARGVIGFARAPAPSDAAFGAGLQPAIYPLLADPPPAGWRVFVRTEPDRLIVTRLDHCAGPRDDRCYRLQTVLHADGRIEVMYIRVPTAPAFRLASPTSAPWLSGVTPGRTAATAPVLSDHYRAYLAHLDALYAPFFGYSLAASLAVLLGMPLLFQGFLISPLNRLLQGLRRFRGGRLDTRIAVSFNDEVGYLTESFNAMARAQEATIQDLEARVADRVAKIAEITVRNAQLEERNRLSADLHDAVAQTLSAASMLSSALSVTLRDVSESGAESARRIAHLNRNALGELRHVLEALRDDRGEEPLSQRLAALAAGFRDLYGLQVDCAFGVETALPAEVRAMFFRVAQESLNNVVKHSGAARAHLAFEALERRALLVVADDGGGFDPGAQGAEGHLGLAIMHDRARRIGATLEVESAPGRGCRVTLIWTAAHVG